MSQPAPELSPANRPRIDEARIGSSIREAYGLEGRLSPLPAEWDQNFRLEAGEKGAFVVKISNLGIPRDVLNFQNEAMAWLASRGGRSPAPAVIPASGGRTIIPIDGVSEGGESRAFNLRVLSWLDGEPCSRIDKRDEISMESIGEAVGALDRNLAGFTHPAMERDLYWDLRKFDWISSQTSRIPGGERRRLVDGILLQFVARILPLDPALPKSVIHNDINDENLLLAPGPDGSHQVAGFLDFGDMVWSNTVNDLAIAATYASFGRREPLTGIREMARGYHRARPLSDAEIEALFPLICMRLCVSVTNSAIAAREDPDNKHRLASDRQAWELLEKLAPVSWAEAEESIRAAVGDGDAIDPGAGAGGAAFDDDGTGEPFGPDRDAVLAERGKSIGSSLSLAYAEPLLITRGRGTYLYDASGRAYLDCVNNVCHVGHSHPRVAGAIADQASILNTNTRYLHPLITEYAERLLATLPDHLEVCFFVNSGTEANELAVRMARTHTGRRDAIVLEGGYHGHSTTLVELSPYKAEGPGGAGLAAWAHKLPKPDPYRGKHRGRDAATGQAYADEAGRLCRDLAARGTPAAFFIAEPAMGCGGQIVFPEGYLREAFRKVKEEGCLAVADEVQVGFGRVGTHMWAFEAQGARPDIVTLGKPIGNGHPLGAVITTRAVADSFANGMEFFSTFGGNPVSMAAGLAVLEVIEEEELQARALEAGRYLVQGFEELARRHAIIGDVRGLGLFVGVELVRDRETLEPATAEAAILIEALKSDGILVTSEGPHANVLKIKPPLSFGLVEADLLLNAVDRHLTKGKG